MGKIQNMRYTKDNGESKERKVIVISRPRQNYLMYDVSELSDEALRLLTEAIEISDECRENSMADFELITGVEEKDLWRAFKPDGIEWTTIE